MRSDQVTGVNRELSMYATPPDEGHAAVSEGQHQSDAADDGDAVP
jgi:hypothetical protein